MNIWKKASISLQNRFLGVEISFLAAICWVCVMALAKPFADKTGTLFSVAAQASFRDTTS